MAPVHKIATDLATSTYKLRVKNTNPVRYIDNHPLLKLLKNPCPQPEITGYIMLYLTEVYRDSPAGEAFWLIERNGLRVPTELWIIPPHWIVQTPTKSIPYFEVLPQGNTSYKMIYVLPEDIIWFKEPDPLNPYGRGRGRAEAIGDEMETDEYMAKYSKNKFFNNAEPPVVVQMPGADEPMIDRTREMWNQNYGGINKVGKTAFVGWDAKITKLNDTEKDMDFIEGRKFLRDTVNQFWNMPPELFGILENSNRSTIDAAYFIYTKNVLSQRLKSFDEVINTQLLPMFDDRLELVHDNVVPQDNEFELKKATEGLKYGGVMVDEWRRSQGLDDLPDNKGQMLYIPLNMTAYPVGADPKGLPNQEEDGKMFKTIKLPKYTEDKKIAIWKSFDNAATKYEKKLEKDLKKYFQNQQDKITKQLMKSLNNIQTKDASKNPDDYLNWKAEIAILYALLQPYWMLAGEEGFNIATNLYSLDIEFDQIVKPELTQWIEQYGLDRVTGITDTTKEALRQSLSEGIQTGESLVSLRDRVSTVFSEAKNTRATLIAQNETMATVDVGTFETYRSAGLEKKEWLSSRDSVVRDSHVTIDGQIRKMNEPFSNGLMYPHDPNGSAKETIRCRCTLIIPDENEE